MSPSAADLGPARLRAATAAKLEALVLASEWGTPLTPILDLLAEADRLWPPPTISQGKALKETGALFGALASRSYSLQAALDVQKMAADTAKSLVEAVGGTALELAKAHPVVSLVVEGGSAIVFDVTEASADRLELARDLERELRDVEAQEYLKGDLRATLEHRVFVSVLTDPDERAALGSRLSAADLPEVPADLNLPVANREEWARHLFDPDGNLVVPQPSDPSRWRSFIGWTGAVNPHLGARVSALNQSDVPELRGGGTGMNRQFRVLLFLVLLVACQRGPDKPPGLEGTGPLVAEFARVAKGLDDIAPRVAAWIDGGELPGVLKEELPFGVAAEMTEVGEAARALLDAAEPDGDAGAEALSVAVVEAADDVVRHLVTVAGGSEAGPGRMAVNPPGPVVFDTDSKDTPPYRSPLERPGRDRTGLGKIEAHERLEGDLRGGIERFVTWRSWQTPAPAPRWLPAYLRTTSRPRSPQIGTSLWTVGKTGRGSSSTTRAGLWFPASTRFRTGRSSAGSKLSARTWAMPRAD